MMEVKKIQSRQNEAYKKLTRLFQKPRERKKTDSFVVEGRREIERALVNGYERMQCWFREESVQLITDKCPVFELRKELFDALSQRSGNENEIAVFKTRHWKLENLDLKPKSKILVAEAPEKPGNIGALIRTAAGAGMDAVFIANPKTDLYNPRSIRNSLGGIFSIPVVLDSSEKIIAYLKNHSFFIAAAVLNNNSINYTDCEYKAPWAIVVGTEAEGLQVQWLKIADACISIPMQPTIDSLNVSVAAGILIYSALE